MLTKKEVEIIDLEEELDQWVADLMEHEQGVIDAQRNIARIKRRLSRLTPVAGDGAGGQTGDVEGETRPAPEHDG